jgi:hypothetical protein
MDSVKGSVWFLGKRWNAWGAFRCARAGAIPLSFQSPSSQSGVEARAIQTLAQWPDARQILLLSSGSAAAFGRLKNTFQPNPCGRKAKLRSE